MPIYITNREAEDLARELAAQTGETITDTVIHALRERRDRLRGPSLDQRVAELLEITKRTAAIIGDERVDFEDLYGEDGLPK